MSSSSGNDRGTQGLDSDHDKLGVINVLGMSRTASQDRAAARAAATSSTLPLGVAPFTPRPIRVDLPSDDTHTSNGRSAGAADTPRSRPFVNPLVHQSSFGNKGGGSLGYTEMSPSSLHSAPDSASRRGEDAEIMKESTPEGLWANNSQAEITSLPPLITTTASGAAVKEINAEASNAPFSPSSHLPPRQQSINPSSTFSQLPIRHPADSKDRNESNANGEEEGYQSPNSKKQEHATPKKALPSKSTTRNGNAATSPVTARGASNPSAIRPGGASSSKPSRGAHHRPGPQLPCAPNVAPAPPPAMYWSKVPVHGSVPRRSFRAHTANLADEVMWLFGGCDAKGCFRELWCFDTETMCWSKPKVTGDLPPPRRAHTSTMVDKRLFVFAGGDGPHYFNDLYVFDTVSLRWSKPDVYGKPPSPRRAHTSNYHNGQLIIFGGGNGVGALNDVYSLDINDPSRLEWRKVECKGKIPIGRGYHTSNLVDGKLIVIGGSDGHMSFNDIHVLQLDTKVWYQVKTDEIHNRLGHTATQVGSYLFIVGGHDSTAYTPEILTLNLVNLQWEPRRVCGQKPPGRGYHQAWLRDSRLFVHGGFDGKDIYDDLYYIDLAACAYLPQITSFCVELDDD